MTGWVDANGVSLRYRLTGIGGALVVLLHELGGCLESWDPVIAGLPGVRTLAYDARGAGLSEKPAGPVTIDDLADDLGGLLSALGESGPVLLVGCAVGAAVAIRFAARPGAPVAGLVLLAPATGIAPGARADTLALADRLEGEGVRARVGERFENNYPLRYFENRDDRALVRGRLLANDPHFYAKMYRMMCATDLSDDLAQIVVPTLVCAGEQDRTRPPERMLEVAQAINGAEFAVVDAGHTIHIHAPRTVANHVRIMLSLEKSATEARR